MVIHVNDTLPFLKVGMDPLLLSARSLAEFLAGQQSFLNVSREDKVIFILIALLKNVIVCLGTNTVVPLLVTLQLLITLTSFIFLQGNYLMKLIIIWGSFAPILCFRARVIRLPPVTRFLISITTMCAVPIYLRDPFTFECIIDVFLIIHAGCYILKTFWGSVEDIIQNFFSEVTPLMIFVAFDLALNGKGYVLMQCISHIKLMPLIVDALRRKDIISFLVFISIRSFFFYEQILILSRRSANITKER